MAYMCIARAVFNFFITQLSQKSTDRKAQKGITVKAVKTKQKWKAPCSGSGSRASTSTVLVPGENKTPQLTLNNPEPIKFLIMWLRR